MSDAYLLNTATEVYYMQACHTLPLISDHNNKRSQYVHRGDVFMSWCTAISSPFQTLVWSNVSLLHTTSSLEGFQTLPREPQTGQCLGAGSGADWLLPEMDGPALSFRNRVYRITRKLPTTEISPQDGWRLIGYI